MIVCVGTAASTRVRFGRSARRRRVTLPMTMLWSIMVDNQFGAAAVAVRQVGVRRRGDREQDRNEGHSLGVAKSLPTGRIERLSEQRKP
jgi:hypothetical protein